MRQLFISSKTGKFSASKFWYSVTAFVVIFTYTLSYFTTSVFDIAGAGVLVTAFCGTYAYRETTRPKDEGDDYQPREID